MSTDYVTKFSYRKYAGEKQNRIQRIWSLAIFEMTSTWRKSTLGKVLLIILVIVNALTAVGAITYASLILENIPIDEHVTFVKEYITEITADSFGVIGVLQTGLGWFIIALIGIAGSGYFADDRQGNVVEVYLSRLTREEYAFGKFLGMILYANIFTTLPIISLAMLYVQGFGLDHFQFIEFYLSIILYGILVALILSLLILILSTLIEKRAYASLSFVLFYFIASIFGRIASAFGDEFLLLLSPTAFTKLLAFSLLGLYEVDQVGRATGVINLNDGVGLEYFNVIGLTGAIIIILFIILTYRIHKLTTENI